MFAGNTAINRAINHQPAAIRVRLKKTARPPMISAAPLNITMESGQGMYGGMIAKYGPGMMK